MPAWHARPTRSASTARPIAPPALPGAHCGPPVRRTRGTTKQPVAVPVAAGPRLRHAGAAWLHPR
eukprot:10873800-Alexandrium_andersonii.AAC.1